MNVPLIKSVQNNYSIPWYIQIQKEVILPQEDQPQIYYSIKPPDYVTALAQTKDGKFIILRQYRPAVEDFTYELPSGHLEDGESPEKAMLRELKEETGCTATDITLLQKIIPDTGRMENRLWAFYIKNIDRVEIPDPARNEGIEVLLVSQSELLQMIRKGQLNHALDLSVVVLAMIANCLKLQKEG